MMRDVDGVCGHVREGVDAARSSSFRKERVIKNGLFQPISKMRSFQRLKTAVFRTLHARTVQ